MWLSCSFGVPEAMRTQGSPGLGRLRRRRAAEGDAADDRALAAGDEARTLGRRDHRLGALGGGDLDRPVDDHGFGEGAVADADRGSVAGPAQRLGNGGGIAAAVACHQPLALQVGFVKRPAGPVAGGEQGQGKERQRQGQQPAPPSARRTRGRALPVGGGGRRRSRPLSAAAADADRRRHLVRHAVAGRRRRSRCHGRRRGGGRSGGGVGRDGAAHAQHLGPGVRRLRASLGIEDQGPVDGQSQLHAGVADRGHRGRHPGPGQPRRRRQRRRADEGAVGGGGEAVEVGPGAFASRGFVLFGRGVAVGQPALRPAFRPLHGYGGAEIGNDRRAEAGHQDVRRLQVAVQAAGGMDGGDAGAERRQQRPDVVDGELAAAAQHRLQVGGVDEVEDQKGGAAAAAPALEPDDGGMIEPGEDLGLLGNRGSVLGDLDEHGAAGFAVEGLDPGLAAEVAQNLGGALGEAVAQGHHVAEAHARLADRLLGQRRSAGPAAAVSAAGRRNAHRSARDGSV